MLLMRNTRLSIILCLALCACDQEREATASDSGTAGITQQASHAAASPAPRKNVPPEAPNISGVSGEPFGPTLARTTGAKEAALHYVDGIEALEAADFQRAVASLTRAVELDEQNSDYVRARGVANALAEDFPAALADLHRADRFSAGGDREARLWLAAAYRMSGDPMTGAQYFTHGHEVPVAYASQVYNDMAMKYWQMRHRALDPEAEENERFEPDKALFAEVATAYARRHKATGVAATDLLLARMQASFKRGDCAAAMNDLVLLRETSPDDPRLRGYFASCLLALGNAYQARKEFTRTLDYLPLWAEGYLGRAQAAAILGDPRRAKADLHVAAGMLRQRHRGIVDSQTQAAEAESVAEVKSEVVKLLEQKPPQDAPARFWESVRTDASWPVLVDAAYAVHRWTNARRLWCDEAYQDRIRVISEAIRDAPNNAGYYELLARFLYNNRVVTAVWNGPRGEGEQLRPQSEAERSQELSRGIDLADAALRLDERYANALATKGWILYILNRGSEAEAEADRGLVIEAKNVRLLRLKAQLLHDHAAALEAQAASLRQDRCETTWEDRSDGRYEIQTCYPPSADQIAQAAGLEAQGAALRQQAGQLAVEADRVESEIIPDLLRQGDAAIAAGDNEGARRAFEQVYAYHPDLGGLQLRLAEVYKRLADSQGHAIFALLSKPMRHTTAAEQLKAAWEHVARTAANSATEMLARAARIDPADARIPAYRSVIAAFRSDAVDARRQQWAALALEEARARLMGTSFLSDSGEPPALEDAGLTLSVRLQAGNALLASGQYDQALEAFAGNLSIERRQHRDALVQLVPSAMLPDPTIDVGTILETPSLASLMAWSRLGTARAMLALGRPAKAEEAYDAVRAYLADWPITAQDRETMYVVDAWARLGMVEAAHAKKEYEAAFRLLTYDGWPWRLPQDLVQRIDAVEEQVEKARERSREQEWQKERAQHQQRVRQLLQQQRVWQQRLTPTPRRIDDMRRAHAASQRERAIAAANKAQEIDPFWGCRGSVANALQAYWLIDEVAEDCRARHHGAQRSAIYDQVRNCWGMLDAAMDEILNAQREFDARQASQGNAHLAAAQSRLRQADDCMNAADPRAKAIANTRR